MRLFVPLIFLLCLAGCGCPHGKQPERLASWQVERLHGCWALMEDVGIPTWATYGRKLEAQGKVKVRDFSSPEKNEFGVSGLDGAADIASGTIYLDQRVLREMHPAHLVIVIADELCHVKYGTEDHVAFDLLHGEWVALYQERVGPFPPAYE